MDKRKEFVAVALTWADTAVWSATGSLRTGANCVGFPTGVAREIGGLDKLVELGEKASMFRRPLTTRMMVDGMMGHLKPIPLSNIAPSDFIMYRVSDRPDHLVIVVKTVPLQFIHMDWFKKTVKVSTQPAGWLPVGAFRVQDLDE